MCPLLNFYKKNGCGFAGGETDGGGEGVLVGSVAHDSCRVNSVTNIGIKCKSAFYLTEYHIYCLLCLNLPQKYDFKNCIIVHYRDVL